jgi:phage recombination protein Bet
MSFEQEKLIKDILCKGASDDEIAVFMNIAKHTRLDPLTKQIWMIPRWDSKLGRNAYTPQVSIDGARLIADRTGNYAPGRSPTYTYKPDGSILSCTAFVKKRTSEGTWHEIEHTCFFDEYVQTFTDKKTGESKVSGLWATKGHAMIAKCAEAGALRKSFPAEMCNLYAEGELDKGALDVSPILDEISQQELDDLYALSVQFQDVSKNFQEYYKVTSWNQLKRNQYQVVKRRFEKELADKAEAFRSAQDGENV